MGACRCSGLCSWGGWEISLWPRRSSQNEALLFSIRLAVWISQASHWGAWALGGPQAPTSQRAKERDAVEELRVVQALEQDLLPEQPS